jgi:hypothetical protein
MGSTHVYDIASATTTQKSKMRLFLCVLACIFFNALI